MMLDDLNGSTWSEPCDPTEHVILVLTLIRCPTDGATTVTATHIDGTSTATRVAEGRLGPVDHLDDLTEVIEDELHHWHAAQLTQ